MSPTANTPPTPAVQYRYVPNLLLGLVTPPGMADSLHSASGEVVSDHPRTPTPNAEHLFPLPRYSRVHSDPHHRVPHASQLARLDAHSHRDAQGQASAIMVGLHFVPLLRQVEVRFGRDKEGGDVV